MNEFYTFQTLATISGASLATYIIVQYTKTIVDKIIHIPTDLYGVFIAFLVLIVAQIAIGANPRIWQTYVLCFFNALFVQATAGKVHDTTLQYSQKNNS